MISFFIIFTLAMAAPAFAETAGEAGLRRAGEFGLKGQVAACFAKVFAEFSMQAPDGTWKPLIDRRDGTNVAQQEFKRRCKR
ncbi:MAG: hypothetical protein ACOVN4_06865 [Bosea sp. (in: a-proteobacteria)]|jgi:hypothetical protein